MAQLISSELVTGERRLVLSEREDAPFTTSYAFTLIGGKQVAEAWPSVTVEFKPEQTHTTDYYGISQARREQLIQGLHKALDMIEIALSDTVVHANES
jgi:hypothetical protein